jgi:GT2 family glycosyltransferase
MAVQLTIQIVGWNSARHLPATLAALKDVPLSEAVIRYIDNASEDNSVELVRSLLPQADIILLPKNMGFAGAHNLALSKCTTPFVLTHDPDVELSWSGIKELLSAFEDERVGAVQGKLLRQKSDGGNILDSAGIMQTITLNGRERGAGEIDHGQYNSRARLLAVTGACGLWRMAALHKVAYPSTAQGAGLQFFDEDFFAYKEDVDLGWRLNNAGYVCLYEPVFMGTHARTLGKGSAGNWGGGVSSFYARLKNKRTRYSLRNYVWMVLKNATVWQLIWREIFIDGRLLIFFVLSLAYPPLFSVWREIWQGAPNMLRKRVDYKTI